MITLLTVSHVLAFLSGAAAWALIVRRNPSAQSTANNLVDQAKTKIDDSKR